MAGKEIANGNCTVAITAGGTGNVSITNSPSIKTKASSSGVFRGGIAVAVSGASSGSCSGASGTGTIMPTALKTKADNQLVNRKDDEVDILVTGVLPSPPGGSCNFTVTVKVTNAGQIKAKAE